jgi:alpha-1,3-rhamnosyl/mannosyltransferase
MKALAALETPHRFFMYAAEKPVVPFSEEPLDIGWELRLGSGPTTRSNILWMQTGVNRLLAADAIDVFWSPRHLLPFRGPRAMATVATIQDFWYLHYPGQQPLANRVTTRLLIERIIQRADRIVTTSAATALDAERVYGIARERVAVVPLAVDHEVFRSVDAAEIERATRSHALEGAYVLAMDAYNPRKNARALLGAFAALPDEIREHTTLAMTGAPRRTANEADIAAIAASLGIAHRLRLLGDVPFADLPALYSGASAFAYPSVYEGFGMPVLEAMSCGCPVVTSSVSSLPEVAGEAALLVAPDDVAGLSDALVSVLSDEPTRERLRDAGIERAAGYTWERTASQMLEVFESALRGRSS